VWYFFIFISFQNQNATTEAKTLYGSERKTLPNNSDDIDIYIETLLFGNDDYSFSDNSRLFEKVRTFHK
jgi:hypothetical protein